MVRTVAYVLCLLGLAGALVGATVSGPHALGFGAAPAILLLGLLFERYLYKPIQTEAPGAGWTRTDERFADPKTGQTVTVYFNPRTGERRYVAG